MRVIDQLESPVVNAFKGVPSMPENAKETLVKAWPWIALVLGVFQLLAAVSAWQALQFVDRFYGYYTAYAITPTDRVMGYVGIAILVFNAVIFFMAFSPLKNRAKRGWDLLFLAAVVNVAYSIAAIFMHGYGVGSFVMGLIGTALGFYLLVQVREKYMGRSTVAKKNAKSESAKTDKK